MKKNISYISNTSNKDLMTQARGALKGKWGLAIGVSIAYMFLASIFGFISTILFIIFPKLEDQYFGIALNVIDMLYSFIIIPACVLGFTIFFLALTRNKEVSFYQIFSGFKKMWVAVGTYLLQMVFILLWSLLLIIPGIFAAYSYSMSFYVLADNDDFGPMQALSKSKEIMYGNRWKLFCLGCRFIGWFLLCILTLGIGLLWLFPYLLASFTKFYDDLKPAKELITND